LKALLITDNQRLITDIRFYLNEKYPGMVVVAADESGKSVAMIEAEPPDLIILDASLPTNQDMPDLIRKIREFSEAPLIILSESETDVDKARWIETGVDGYAAKPLNPVALLAMIRAILRRSEGTGFKSERTVSLVNGLSINYATHQVFLSGNEVKLTPTEYRLLSELARNKGRVLDNRSLLAKVWGSEYVDDSSFPKKYIYRLRQKLHDDSGNHQMIHTERGIGYRFY